MQLIYNILMTLQEKSYWNQIYYSTWIVILSFKILLRKKITLI